MNQSRTNILITLRDGGSLYRDICFCHATLQRKTGGVVSSVRLKTLRDLIASNYLQENRPLSRGQATYCLTDQGLKIARSIRNRRTP